MREARDFREPVFLGCEYLAKDEQVGEELETKNTEAFEVWAECDCLGPPYSEEIEK